jgi:glycosyltransferase involved in cell wall biosynthesis
VEPRDVAALGAALTRLLGDPELRRRIGEDARAAVLPRFGVDRYVDSVAALYDRLLVQEGA